MAGTGKAFALHHLFVRNGRPFCCMVFIHFLLVLCFSPLGHTLRTRSEVQYRKGQDDEKERKENNKE